jgi:hypothetical protein
MDLNLGSAMCPAGDLPGFEGTQMSNAPKEIGAVEREEAATLLGISMAELMWLIRWGEILTCRSETRRHLVPISEIRRQLRLRSR